MATSTYTQILSSLNIPNRHDFGEHFITNEAERMKDLLEDIKKDGIMADYTILSIAPVMKWFIGRAKGIQTKTDISVLENINPLILDSAYYLGESFVRSTHTLSWRTEPQKTPLPSVTGFKFNINMCPLTDSYTIFEDILIKRQNIDEIERTILMWLIRI